MLHILDIARHLMRLKYLTSALIAVSLWAGAAITQLASAQSLPSSLEANTTILSASGETHPVRGQVWIDVSGTATVADLEAMSRSSRPIQMQTYKQSTTQLVAGQAAWVKISLLNTSQSDRWYLQAQHPAYERITLYAQDVNGQWQSRAAGIAIPRTDWPMATRLPAFEIKPPIDRSLTHYWLKLTHTGTPYYTTLIAAQEQVLMSQQQRDTLWFGLGFGIILASLVLSLTQARMLKDAAYYLHAIYAGVYMLFAAFHLGIVQRYFLPDLTASAYALSRALPTASMAVALWFAFEVLGTKANRFMFQTSRVLIFVLVIFSLSELFSLGFFKLSDSYLLVLFSALCGLVMIVTAILRGRKSIRIFGWGFVPMLVCILPPIVHHLGWADIADIAQYPLILGPVFEIPLLHYALMIRSNQRREGFARASALSNKDALTGLMHISAWLDNLKGCIARAERFHHSYGLMCVDIINHEWFRKEFGSETADRVMLLVASQLQRHFSEVDCICRVSGAKFVVAIEGATNMRELSKSCTHILAAAKTADPLLPVGRVPKLHLTCALMPKAHPSYVRMDAQTILAWLIESSEDMRDNPNQAVQTLGF